MLLPLLLFEIMNSILFSFFFRFKKHFYFISVQDGDFNIITEFQILPLFKLKKPKTRTDTLAVSAFLNLLPGSLFQ